LSQRISALKKVDSYFEPAGETGDADERDDGEKGAKKGGLDGPTLRPPTSVVLFVRGHGFGSRDLLRKAVDLLLAIFTFGENAASLDFESLRDSKRVGSYGWT
jgi:hypothetical protein